ncbi:ABC transporter ATP-binding protein [Methylacidimicrobium sp. B4]|uniref:ABC transporter ATP-binding protein n=1 Tax=Methylacidimicrobium sp. B4 TaxID=2796139 RepID=UPI001A8C7D86|nr:ATP-binding cassette domain-containing protein [Methylacidimicrobium sp. B4]QSR84360.1 ATP-binding cassette domain-containing protein [Methylacidimicrobium sp. B4]
MTHQEPFPAGAFESPLLEIEEASVRRGERWILDRLSLRLPIGRHTAILGPNGSGKSTLVKLIAREIYPSACDDGRARVRVLGRDRWNVAELRGLLGIVSPALERDLTVDPPLEALEAVVSGFFAARGLGPNHSVTEEMRQRALQALDLLGAGHLVGREMATLSSGEARRVLIARSLVHRPRALLLDEPCEGLDLVSRRRFLESLSSLAQAGTTLLLITHHIEEILPEIDQVLLLRDGRMVQQGKKAKTLTDVALSTAFGMPIRVNQSGAWYHARLA